MKVQKLIHKKWKEANEINKDKETSLHLDSVIGKYQYIYSGKKGTISLIELTNFFQDNVTLWEIYSTKGDLIDVIERFDSKKEAEIRIAQILGEPIPTKVVIK